MILGAVLGAVGLCQAQEADAVAPAATINPLAGLSLEALEATRSAPLFTPSRTAPPPVSEGEPEVVAAPPPPPPPAPSFKLIGLVMSGTTEFALLRDRSSGEIFRAVPGEELGGWSVVIIDERTLELRSGDQVERLTMFEEFEAVGGPGDVLGPGVGNEALMGLPPEFMDEEPGLPPELQGLPPEFFETEDGTPIEFGPNAVNPGLAVPE